MQHKTRPTLPVNSLHVWYQLQMSAITLRIRSHTITQSNGGTSIHIQASQGQIHLSMNRIHLSLNRNARAVDNIQRIFSLRPRHTSIVNLLSPEETLYLYRCFLDVTIAHSQSDGINTRDWCDLRLKVIDRGAIIKPTCTILYTTRASPKLSRLSWPISYEAHIISYHPGLPP